ncbi:MAG: hypothetical protein ABL982_13435, partial [Vicinamibacterales bacterium]
TTLLLLCALMTAGCGAPPGDSTPPAEPAAAPAVPAPGASPAERPTAIATGTPGDVRRGDASTNLDTTPVSAADYAMYAAIMSGASAMLAVLSTADREALALAKKVDAGTVKATPSNQARLAQARALRQKDIELARLQGIDGRYLQVKSKIEAVIGPDAHPPASDVEKENLRFLEAHRSSIERVQKILRDPLNRPADPR